MKAKLTPLILLTAAYGLCACPQETPVYRNPGSPDRICEDITGLNLTDQYKAGILQQKITFKEIDPHTLIHKAILENSPLVIRFLLAQGVSVDYPDKNGMTPLTIAILNQCHYAVDVLLTHGANVNPQVKWNSMSLLDLSLSLKDICSAGLLVERGVDINVKSNDESSLTKVIRIAYTERSIDWAELAKKMVHKGADIHRAENNDCPLLGAVCLAHLTGNRSLLELFLEKGININLVKRFHGKEQSTALLQAISNRDLPLVKFLVESGADVNKSINYGRSEIRTPLKYSLSLGQPEIVQYLLQHGAKA